MLVEVDPGQYLRFFPLNPHPFISPEFLELNKAKVERIVHLVQHDNKELGLIAGINKGALLSPFSAPFGGFHFKHKAIYINVIDQFVAALKDYIESSQLESVKLTLPPDIYHQSFNAKTINSLFRNSFGFQVPDISSHIDLNDFSENYSHPNSRNYYRQAKRNGLVFSLASSSEEKEEVYKLILQNRIKFNRPIYMTLNDILDNNNLWPVDFLRVTTSDGVLVASAIFYRFNGSVCYGVFRADNDLGRQLRSVDFLDYNTKAHYKHLGYRYIDEGISTESGEPNQGLLRFKETHEGVSSLRFRYYWTKR